MRAKPENKGNKKFLLVRHIGNGSIEPEIIEAWKEVDTDGTVPIEPYLERAFYQLALVLGILNHFGEKAREESYTLVSSFQEYRKGERMAKHGRVFHRSSSRFRKEAGYGIQKHLATRDG